ncbi:hypothetical protein BX666DRAFT_1521851 [Dichotomocladium elegans]|nr:hypothetical protein BX666DRAFT_1521851 [Dichotomocladium elegans]
MLTWCELSTANVPVPPVCVPPLSSHKKAQQCVILLASVPQTWTSYSGYYRDAESMCLAIRYPIERELIEQVHHNVTRQQLSNLLLLKEHHQEITEWREQEIASLVNITHTQQHIWDELQIAVKTMHGQTKQNLSEITGLVAALRGQLQKKQEEQMTYLNVMDASYREAVSSFLRTTEHDFGVVRISIQIKKDHMDGVDTYSTSLATKYRLSTMWKTA